MGKYFCLFFIFVFPACSTVYLDEYREKNHIAASASYDSEALGIALSWDYADDSVRMEILRGAASDRLSLQKNLSGQKEWLDPDTAAGLDYFYRIDAYSPQGRRVASSDVLKGRRAYQDSASAFPPDAFRVDAALSLTKISLSWIGHPGQSYRIYRSLSAGSGYGEIALSTRMSFEDTGLAPGTTYYYKISVIYQDSGIVKEKFYGGADLSSGTYVSGSTLSESL